MFLRHHSPRGVLQLLSVRNASSTLPFDSQNHGKSCRDLFAMKQ